MQTATKLEDKTLSRVPALRRVVGCALIIFAVTVLPCSGYVWLYDSGPIYRTGPVIQNSLLTTQRFWVPIDSYVSVVGAALSRATANFAVNVRITTTTPGLLPDATIAELAQPLAPTSPIYQYCDGTLQTPVLLTANVIYSLVFVPTSSDCTGSISWAWKIGGYLGMASFDGGQSWSVEPYPFCVHVGGDPVPEPSCLALLAGGVILALRRRSR
jgi:hypothetical protein